MRWFRMLLLNERGVYLTMAAVLLPVCLLAAAVFADVGMLYVTKSHYQNAADAAALAGVRELPDHAAAKETVARYLAKNGVALSSAGDLSVTYSDDGEMYAESQGESYCRVIYSAPAQSLVMEVLRGEASKIRVRATAKKEGGDGYMIFANDSDPARGNTTLTLQINNAAQSIAGKIHSNGGIMINANNTQFHEDSATASGSAAGSAGSQVTTGVPQQPMPKLEAQMRAYENDPSKHVWKGETFNYTNDGSGYDAIIATGDIFLVPDSGIGKPGKPVFIASKTGQIFISSGTLKAVYAILYAPAPTSMLSYQGKITVSLNNASFYGSIVGGIVGVLVSNIELAGGGGGRGEIIRLVE